MTDAEERYERRLKTYAKEMSPDGFSRYARKNLRKKIKEMMLNLCKDLTAGRFKLFKELYIAECRQEERCGKTIDDMTLTDTHGQARGVGSG